MDFQPNDWNRAMNFNQYIMLMCCIKLLVDIKK